MKQIETAKEFLEAQLVDAESLGAVFMGGTTACGNYILVMPPNMELKALIAVRKMITDRIKDMKEGEG